MNTLNWGLLSVLTTETSSSNIYGFTSFSVSQVTAKKDAPKIKGIFLKTVTKVCLMYTNRKCNISCQVFFAVAF
jgi:hypothetical protein